MTRKTPEEIAELTANDNKWQGSIQGGCFAYAKHAADLAYEEADKYPIEGTWQWACQQMREGWKVTRSWWAKDDWLHTDSTGRILDSIGDTIDPFLSDMNATDWELYEEKLPDSSYETVKGMNEEAIKNYLKETPVELKEGQVVSVDGEEFKIVSTQMQGPHSGNKWLDLEPIPQWEEVSHNEAISALEGNIWYVQTKCGNALWETVILIGNEAFYHYQDGEKEKLDFRTDRKWRIRKK